MSDEKCHRCHNVENHDTETFERLRRQHWWAYPEPDRMRDGKTLPGILGHLREQFGESSPMIGKVLKFRHDRVERENVARIQTRYPDYVEGDEVEPDRAEQRARKRAWAMHASSCTSPDDLERLARECLEGGPLEAALAVVRIWRGGRGRTAQRLDAEAMDSLVASANVKPVEPAPHWTERGER